MKGYRTARRAPAACMPACLLALLLAAPARSAERAALPRDITDSRAVDEADGLAVEMKSRVAASTAELEKLLKEAEAASERLEKLGPAYSSARDWDAAGRERGPLRREIGDWLEKVYRERSSLDDMRKNLEARQGAQLITTMLAAGMGARAREDRMGRPARPGKRSPERVKTAIETVEGPTGDMVRSTLGETFDLRDVMKKSMKRVDAVVDRLNKDDEAWGLASQERAKLRNIHLAFFALCGVALAAAAWMCYKRLPA